MHICVLARGIPDELSPMNGIYEWGQAIMLAESGYDVTYISVDIRKGKNRAKRGLSFFTKNGVKIYNYGFPIGRVKKIISVMFRYRVCDKIFQKLEKDGILPNYVWAFFGRTLAPVAYKLKKKYGTQYVISEYESRLITQPLKSRKKRNLIRVYNEALRIYAPNISFCRELTAITGLQTEFLPQTISDFPPHTKHNDFVFLSIGALNVEKGMEEIIRAFASVKSNNPWVRLVIVGSGEERRALGEQAKSLGVSDYIEFVPMGMGKGLKSRIAESDCFVLASPKEMYGTVYFEALSGGIPVITTDCFSAIGLIPDYAGKIINAGDTKALKKAMEEACQKPSPYSYEKIKGYASGIFSRDAIFEKIKKFLSEVTEMRSAQDIL